MSRSGFVALAGRPNVGKSTFVNAVVGEKIAIVSDRPQTTRRAIRGVHHSGDCQLVLVDLPGVQRPRDALTSRMAKRVNEELAGADAALLILNGRQGVGPGDRFIAQTLRRPGVPVAVAVNKVDRMSRAELLAVLEQAAALELDGEVFPISARSGAGLPELVAHLGSLMPEGPFMFASDSSSDQPLEEIELLGDGMTRVRALIWVESNSQKGILIGAHGSMIKAIGTAARKELQRLLDGRVHLDLSVRVRHDWRGDEGLLDRLGIT
jgi:GTP-binding protein Era